MECFETCVDLGVRYRHSRRRGHCTICDSGSSYCSNITNNRLNILPEVTKTEGDIICSSFHEINTEDNSTNNDNNNKQVRKEKQTYWGCFKSIVGGFGGIFWTRKRKTTFKSAPNSPKPAKRTVSSHSNGTRSAPILRNGSCCGELCTGSCCSKTPKEKPEIIKKNINNPRCHCCPKERPPKKQIQYPKFSQKRKECCCKNLCKGICSCICCSSSKSKQPEKVKKNASDSKCFCCPCCKKETPTKKAIQYPKYSPKKKVRRCSCCRKICACICCSATKGKEPEKVKKNASDSKCLCSGICCSSSKSKQSEKVIKNASDSKCFCCPCCRKETPTKKAIQYPRFSPKKKVSKECCCKGLCASICFSNKTTKVDCSTSTSPPCPELTKRHRSLSTSRSRSPSRSRSLSRSNQVRASRSRQTRITCTSQKSNMSSCCPNSSPYTSYKSTNPYQDSRFRTRSLSLNNVRPNSSRSGQQCCQCCNCQAKRTLSPKRDRCQKVRRPRSCPRPTKCSCIVCSMAASPKPCRTINVPCPPSSLCRPSVPKRPGQSRKCCEPSPCCQCGKPKCQNKTKRPKVSRHTSCCSQIPSSQPMTYGDPVCCPCPSSMCYLSGLGSKYDRSKRGDALCNMLMAKYSKSGPHSYSSRLSSYGGGRVCPFPGVKDGAMPIPGNNKTNSRHSCSPGEKKKKVKISKICFTKEPNEKKPYKEVDLSASIYTPCVKHAGLRSDVQHFHALKRTESQSPCRGNINNGAITDASALYDTIRSRVEVHYDRFSRFDQAYSLQKCEASFDNFYQSLESSSSVCDGYRYELLCNNQCRNNNFGDENFRFFRKYLNITPSRQTSEIREDIQQREGGDFQHRVVARDRSQNRETRDDIGDIQQISTAEFDEVSDRISRLDNWILGNDRNHSEKSFTKANKGKTLNKKKSAPIIGDGSIRKKSSNRIGQRKNGASLNRTTKLQNDNAAASALLTIQNDLNKSKSPSKRRDSILSSAEIKQRTPSSANSTSFRENISESFKLSIPESTIKSPRIYSTEIRYEREEYTPTFKREEIKKCEIPENVLPSPRTVPQNITSPPAASYIGDSVSKRSPNTKNKADMFNIKISNETSSAVDSRIGTKSPSTNFHDFSKQIKIKRDKSPKHSSPKFAKRVGSPLSKGESSVDEVNYPKKKSYTQKMFSPNKSETCQLTPVTKRRPNIFMRIASIWGPRSQRAVRSECSLATLSKSKEHILDGKESSVDIPSASVVRKPRDDSSNNDYNSHAVMCRSVISESVENYSDIEEEGEIDFDLNAHSSRESLVAVNKSNNQGDSPSDDDSTVVPPSHSITNIDSISSDNVPEVDRIRIESYLCTGQNSSENNTTDIDNVTTNDMTNSNKTMVNEKIIISGGTEINTAIKDNIGESLPESCATNVFPSNVTQFLPKHNLGEPNPNATNLKPGSILAQFFAQSRINWQRVEHNDIDVASIRRAKQVFMEQQKRKRAQASSKYDVNSKLENNHTIAPCTNDLQQEMYQNNIPCAQNLQNESSKTTIQCAQNLQCESCKTNVLCNGNLQNESSEMNVQCADVIKSKSRELNVPCTDDVQQDHNKNLQNKSYESNAPYTENLEIVRNKVNVPCTEDCHNLSNETNTSSTKNIQQEPYETNVPFAESIQNESNETNVPYTNNLENESSDVRGSCTENIRNQSNEKNVSSTKNLQDEIIETNASCAENLLNENNDHQTQCTENLQNENSKANFAPTENLQNENTETSTLCTENLQNECCEINASCTKEPQTEHNKLNAPCVTDNSQSCNNISLTSSSLNQRLSQGQNHFPSIETNEQLDSLSTGTVCRQ